jgi:uridine phosphorylase/ketosteroid isomerase-like protein
MSLEENKALVRRYFEDAPFNPDACDEIFSPRFQFHAIAHTNMSPQVIECTPQSEKAFYERHKSIWGGWHLTIEEMIAEGDRVMVRWTSHGIHQGESHGLPPTGKRVTNCGVNIFRIEEGRIAEVWDIFDRLWIWQQLGVLPGTSEALAKARERTSHARAGATASSRSTIGTGTTGWFDPSEDAVIQPAAERIRRWGRTYGTGDLPVSSHALYVNNGLGRLFDAVCRELDRLATATHDHRQGGYCHYRAPSGTITVYRASEPAPYAAADLELLIDAGARQIVFVNGTGSLRADLPVGSLLLPGELLREEGTSYHYAPPEARLHTDEPLNARIRQAADALGIAITPGAHWTTDAIYRETYAKVERYRALGIHSVEMELSALAGVAHYRHCTLSAILVVTDVLSRSHTWTGIETEPFSAGVERAARLAARVFLGPTPNHPGST